MAWITAAVTGVQRGKDTVTYGLKGDWAGSLVNGLALGGKVAEALFKRQASDAFKKSTEAAAKKMGMPTPTYIIDAMMLAINLVALLNGFGDERAACIKTAKEQLENVKQSLEMAVPDSRDWSGDSADAYVAMVTKLSAFVDTMETLDVEFQNLVINQADSVKKANMCIAYSTLALIASYIPALALYAVPIIGPELSWLYQVVAATAVGFACFAMEMLTLANSMSVSNSLNSTLAKYDALGTNVVNQMSGDFGSIETTLKGLQGKTTEKTTVGGFTEVSDGLSDFTATPTISSLVNAPRANVAPTQRALVNALSDPATAAAGAPSVTSTDTLTTATAETTSTTATTEKATQPAASVTAPSLAQMGQASQPLGSVGQTATQGTQQIQQLIQSAKNQGAPAAAAPAAHEVGAFTNAPDDEAAKEAAEAGASSAKDGTGRAPVEAATSAGAPAGAGRERVL
jgi:EspA/EspE family